ncbi:MAG: MATE family efflux transporter [Eubacteriales bacterium]|nr:MATE family efflux transporter [Eubacteriales bacterium]
MENLSKGKLLIKYVTPSILSMVSIFLFSIIDGLFTGRGVGSDALGAVNIAFPFIMIFTAIITLTNVGGLTITAIRTGRGDEKGARQAFIHSFALTTIISAIFCILGTVFVDTVTRLLGANDYFFELARDYIFYYAIFFIPCGMCMAVNGFGRNDKLPVYVSVCVIISTAINIFGDWLLIFPMQMGIKGAAIATGVAQTVGMLMVLPHFLLKKGNLYFEKIDIDTELIKKIFLRGLPGCISSFAPPISIILHNYRILELLGEKSVNAYAVIGYIAAFSVAVFNGTAEGLQPLFGQCYGAKKYKDLKWYLRSGLIIGFVGAVVIYILLLFFATPLCVLYGLDAETLDITVKAMPQHSIGYWFESFVVIISGYLYSTTRTKASAAINILKGFVIIPLTVFIVPMLFGPQSIWFAFPAEEAIMMVIAILMLIKLEKDLETEETLD